MPKIYGILGIACAQAAEGIETDSHFFPLAGFVKVLQDVKPVDFPI